MNIIRKNKLLCKQDLIINSLKKYYYNDNEKIGKIQKIAGAETKKAGKRDISLRVIEWFVTNYAKKYGISWSQEEDTRGKKTQKQFNVFLSYKSQLNAYSKKQFDPFCRRKRIEFEYNDDGDVLTTTIGQLNFFRWAIENNIINYVEEHQSEIEKDMNESMKHNYKKSKSNKNIEMDTKQRKKRNELSKSATRKINIHSYNITLSFD